jgi:phospholipid/cholesterol/gamma-HCH transport system substrate-binding protein
MENRSHALMTGFFTIALVIGAVLAGIWFNRDRVVRVPYQIATTLSVPGLNPQAAVRYRGLEVGKVDDIAFDPKVPGQILVHLSIDPETPITKTTFATLGYQGVTGIAYVQLDDEAVASTALASDDRHLARIPLRPGFFDQLEKRGNAILVQTEQLTARLNTLVNPANQKSLTTAIDNIGKAAERFGEVPQKLDPMLSRLPQLTDKFDQSMSAFTTFSDNAAKLSDNWDKLATSLQAPDGPIAHLNGTFERVGGSLEGMASDVELQTLPHVTAMTDEARSSLRAVKRTMTTLNDRPQSLIFGAPTATPGPGEPGFAPPSK